MWCADEALLEVKKAKREVDVQARDLDPDGETGSDPVKGGRRMITIKIELHDVEDARNTAAILRVLAQEV